MTEEDQNLQSLFANLNQVSRNSILRARAGGGTGGGSEVAEGSMDPNKLMINNPYIAKNVIEFNQGGMVGASGAPIMNNPYLQKVNELVALQQFHNIGKGLMASRQRFDDGGTFSIPDPADPTQSVDIPRPKGWENMKDVDRRNWESHTTEYYKTLPGKRALEKKRRDKFFYDNLHVTWSGGSNQTPYNIAAREEKKRRQEEAWLRGIRKKWTKDGKNYNEYFKDEPGFKPLLTDEEWAESQDNPDNFTDAWQTGYDDWYDMPENPYKPKKTEDTGGGYNYGETTRDTKLRAPQQEVVNYNITPTQAAARQSGSRAGGVVNELGWAADKDNPFLTENILEEVDYAAKGMKMKKRYTQGGRF